ncbi:MAG: hypothetical protein M0R06_02540 [Sphaerochaeta sp.]|jgi:hypothetical protein|nr:hypothetical protein [Sphaerochaeta sp.]
MAFNRELEREFGNISDTNFWKRFVDELTRRRKQITSQLECGESIGKPCVRGDVWQAELRVWDSVLKMPDKIIGYEKENKENDVAERGE